LSGVFFCLKESGGRADAFAGKPAPKEAGVTLSNAINCGSGLAREEAGTDNQHLGTT
jgi:hypothetical protein